LTVPLLHMK